MAGGYVGWGLVANQANTSTGGALGEVADVSGASVGLGVGGPGVANTYSSAPPVPPPILGFLLLETGVLDYLLQEDGFRIQLE